MTDTGDGGVAGGGKRKPFLERRTGIATIAVAAFGGALVVGWVLFAPPKADSFPLSAVADPFYDYLSAVMRKNASDVDLLVKLNFLVQSVLVVSALIATVLAALTTTATAAKYKIYSIIVTATTSAAASFLTSFHVRDNVNTFVLVEHELNVIEAKYLKERKPFEIEGTVRKNGKEERGIVLRDDAALLDIHVRYVEQVSGFVKDRSLSWANVGIQGSAPGVGTQGPKANAGIHGPTPSAAVQGLTKKD